jgi:beta-hydroxylase
METQYNLTEQNPHFFYEVKDFPYLKLLENNYLDIKEELQQLIADKKEESYWFNAFPHYVESKSELAWNTFTFLFFGIEVKAHKLLCPKTWKLLSQIPELISADFSYMKPHTHIKPHKGFTNKVLRVHLGLIIPENCWLRVGTEKTKWQEGKLMIFDDSYDHEAVNASDKDRVVLMFDIPNPLWNLSGKEISRDRIYNMTDKFMLNFLSKDKWIELYEKGSFD